MDRKIVYELLDGERDFQDAFTKERSIGTLTVAGELLLLEEYITRARKAWVNNRGDRAALDVIRKIGGIAVRCIEHHGAPPRGKKSNG